MNETLVKLIQKETRIIRDLARIISDYYYTPCSDCLLLRALPIKTTTTRLHELANNILLSYWCPICVPVRLYDGRPLPQGAWPAVYFVAPPLGSSIPYDDWW